MGVILVPPMDRRRTRRWTVRHPARLVAGLFVAVAVIGAVVWVAGLSPASFDPVSASGGARAVSFAAGGEYVVLERRVGDQPPAVSSLVVQSAAGVQVSIDRSLSDDGAGLERNLPLFASWEVARFVIDEPGTYTMYAVRPEAASQSGAGTLAIAPARSLGWLGSWLGLMAMVGVPLLAAAGVLVGAGAIGRRRVQRSAAASGT
jgi:hypothetical protein